MFSSITDKELDEFYTIIKDWIDFVYKKRRLVRFDETIESRKNSKRDRN
jgi:hypothetical protein